MIHLCVVWRNNKWVVTSSDTVTFQEEVHPALAEYYEKLIQRSYDAILKDVRELLRSETSWKDSEITQFLNEGQRKLNDGR